MSSFGTITEFLTESTVNKILTSLENDVKQEGIYKKIENDDYVMQFDDDSDHVTFSWIYMKSKKYRGTDILKALIKYTQKKNLKYISGYGIKGYDTAVIDGKRTQIQVNGYYTLMRWGFIPNKGIKFINKTLNTNYKSLEDAYSDPDFWPKWKEDGVEYTGEFDINLNSLSFKVLDKKI